MAGYRHIRARLLVAALSIAIVAPGVFATGVVTAADPGPTTTPTPSVTVAPTLTPAPTTTSAPAPVAPPAPQMTSAPEPTVQRTELIDRRTETSKSYDAGDGTITTELFSEPIHYRPEAGAAWQPIDLTFRPVAGADKAARLTDSPVIVNAAPGNDARGFLTVTLGGHPITLRPVTVSRDVRAASEPTLDRSSARIAEALPGIDLVVSASSSGVNSFFVLAAPPKDPSISFLVDAPGLTLVADRRAGSVGLVDGSGTQIGSFLAPYAVDSTPDAFTGSGRTTTSVTYTLSTINGNPALTVSVDPAWLESAVYPVYVDPTIYNNGLTAYGDAHVNQGNPSLNYANYKRPDAPGYYEMWLGESPSDSTYYNEAFIKFDLSTIAGTTIDSANLEVRPYHQYYNAPTSTTTWLRRVTATWAENTIKWSNKPPVASGWIDSTGCVEAQQCAFAITSLVRGWLDGTYPNYGVRLDENGNGPTYWKRLIASEQQTTTRPRLIVTNHVPTATAISTAGWKNNRDVSWTYSDPASHAQSHFELDVSTSATFASLLYDGPATAGALTTTSIPAGVTLTSGTTYYWRVRARDGTSWSSWSSSSFQWDATAPAAPSTPDLIAASDTGSSATDNITFDTTTTFTGAAESGATVTIYDGVGAVGSAVATGGAWTITTSALTPAAHSITAKATDVAGNQSSASSGVSVTIDGDDPTVLMVINQGALKSSSTTVEIEFIADDATSEIVTTEASNDNVAFTSVSGTTPTWTLSAGNGAKTVWLRVTDTAGRTTTVSDGIILDSTLPIVVLDKTTLSMTIERGTLRRESVTVTPSQTLFGATLELSSSLASVVDPVLPAGQFKAMDEVGLYVAVDVDVPQTAQLGPQSGTLIVRSSGGVALATVSIQVTVVDPPAGFVPATLSTASSDRNVVDADGDKVVVDMLIVALDASTPNPAQRILAIAAAHGGLVRGSIASARMYQVQKPGVDDPAELETLRLSLAAESNVSFVSPSYDGELDAVTPNDPDWQDAWDENAVGGKNWSMELIKMPTAWSLQTGSRSVPVAIVDSGIDLDHPDLAPNKDIYNIEFGKRNGNEPHGTHVAGIACAKGNNNLGVTGVAWDCSLRGYEVGLGALKPEAVAAAMIKAADDGARIVNLSLGSKLHSDSCGNLRQKKLDETTAIYRQAIQTVINNSHDVLWVIAAGNDPCDAAMNTPANLSVEFANVITVASVNDDGELSNFSARGIVVTVAAAGGQGPDPIFGHSVWSTIPYKCGIFGLSCSGYAFAAGTSQAAPQVTGLAALVLSSHPGLTAVQVKDCIVASANTNGIAVAGQTFHVIHAPSAIACGPETETTTSDQWRTLELSWAGGTTNAEPSGWQNTGFDDSGWSAAYIPLDPYPAWVDIAGADWLSSTGRDTGHLTSEIWIARDDFDIAHPITAGATLTWNVDNTASIWINGNLLVTNTGTWSSVTTTAVPASFLRQGANTIGVKVFQDANSNSWSVNPTFFQAKLTIP